MLVLQAQETHTKPQTADKMRYLRHSRTKQVPDTTQFDDIDQGYMTRQLVHATGH